MPTPEQKARVYDVAIIGGGINGAGIARDAAMRGLSVLLCEKGDLASGTSSASTKLIHGGLRYLEQFDFRLVRESLEERTALLSIAPHIVWPLRFILPYEPHQRPRWMIRAGLWFYDRFSRGGPLPPSSFFREPVTQDLKEEFRTGFIYSDCWVQDARLVVLNAMDAADHKALILPRHACIGTKEANGRWEVTLRRVDTGEKHVFTARCLVNAAGPWAAEVTRDILPVDPPLPIRLVKGSHIVIRRRLPENTAYLFQQADGRIVFAIAYEKDFTLIGTTEVELEAVPPEGVHISPKEIDYLCAAATHYFREPVHKEEVIWHYAGIRPLFGDSGRSMTKASRDYRLIWAKTEVPLLLIHGGKLTTYRRLAERIVDDILKHLGRCNTCHTAEHPLPGGNMAEGGLIGFIQELTSEHPWLPPRLAEHYARHYGTRTAELIGDARSLEDLGNDYGSGFHEAEVDYLRRMEFAVTAEDMLWRRTKRGLHLPVMAQEALKKRYG